MSQTKAQLIDPVDGTIVNADINDSAAIAGTKISPDFGSQNITTTGSLGASGFSTTGGEISLTGTVPRIGFTDSNANSDFRLKVDGGSFQIEDITNSSADRLVINSSGNVGIGTSSPIAKFDVTDGTTSISFNKTNNTPRIDFKGNNVSDLCQIKAAESSGGGIFQFLTKTTGGTATERMRIDSSGSVNIGSTGYAGGGVNPILYLRSTSGRQMKIHNTASSTCGIQLSNNTTGEGEDAGFQLAVLSTGDGFINNPHSKAIIFNTANTERMRIDSSGKIGIGRTDPVNFVDIHRGADEDNILIVRGQDTSGEYCALGVNGSNAIVTAGGVSGNNTNLVFRTAPNGNETERMRIDSSGRVLIGTTSVGAHEGGNNFTIAESGHCGMTIRSSTSTSGNIYFADGTSSGESARGEISYRHATDDLRIFTAATERMRINSTGDIFIATTTTNPGFGNNSDPGHYINHVGYVMHSRDNGTALYVARNDSTGSLVSFNYNGGGQIADITTNGSSVSYGTGSDYRLKENITTLTNAITRLKNLKPSRFNFLKTPSITQDGFIAHEVQEVVPEAVTGVKDEVRTEDGDMGQKKGDPVMQSLDVAKLVPLLTAAVQELITKVETLESA